VLFIVDSNGSTISFFFSLFTVAKLFNYAS
jgi:hypothetical protein